MKKTFVQIDNGWRRWITENLLLNVAQESLIQTMVANGFAQDVAAREIALAVQHPYLDAARHMHNRLRKREWLLAVYRKGNRLHSQADGIPRHNKLPRSEFFDNYYAANRPVIITGMMDDWPALQKWNLDFFAREFGDREVEVHTGRGDSDNYEIDRKSEKMKFRDVVEKVRTVGVTNDFYMTANNSSSNKITLAGLWDDIVQIPEYLDGSDPKAGFFWFGPAGTITPFHHDLTNNFMAQVIGRKRVKLVPSWDMPLMQNHYHVYSKVDGRLTPPALKPDMGNPQIIEYILNPGEILFIPIGWMHFVEGLEISVTVSFTNFRADNDFASFYATYNEV